MQTLLEDYQRKLRNINALIERQDAKNNCPDGKAKIRLTLKAAEYRAFIVDIERAIERDTKIPIALLNTIKSALDKYSQNLSVERANAFTEKIQEAANFDYIKTGHARRHIAEMIREQGEKIKIKMKLKSKQVLRPLPPADGSDPIINNLTLADREKEIILKTLLAYDGNREKAAKHLNISLRTLYRRLKKYKIGEAIS